MKLKFTLGTLQKNVVVGDWRFYGLSGGYLLNSNIDHKFKQNYHLYFLEYFHCSTYCNFCSDYFFNMIAVYLLTSWVIKHKKGQMSYSNGYLRVGVQGYYYIYSQIYYRDGRSTMTGYMMYIDDKPALKASNSVISSSRRFNTNYMGGIFHLDAGQKISVRTFYRQEFYFSEETSYFGAFMIHQ